jgi:glycine/D-amino acid oxidase-like deaminating enzyme
MMGTMATNRSRVLVIGAGVVGASIAYRLAGRGVRVTLLERALPGGGTSASSFAWVNSNEKPPLAYHRLNAESLLAHRRLRDDLQADLRSGPAGQPGIAWLHEGGGLEWAVTEEGRARLLEKAGRLQAWGYRIEVIDVPAVRALEPHLRLDGLTAATFCPDEAWVDAPAMVACLVAAAQAQGAEVRSGTAGEVRAFEHDGDRVAGVRVASGERLVGEHVVVAAGRWTDRVAGLAGIEVPLAPTCGLLAVTSVIDRGVSRVVHVPGMHFRPDPSGGLVLQSGATDATVTMETPADPDLPGCKELLARLVHFLPAAASARIVAARVGVRPMPADGYPIVGPVEARPGLYLAVTHSGVTLAPLLGEIVATELATGTPDPRLASFRPARCVRSVG